MVLNRIVVVVLLAVLAQLVAGAGVGKPVHAQAAVCPLSCATAIASVAGCPGARRYGHRVVRFTPDGLQIHDFIDHSIDVVQRVWCWCSDHQSPLV
jgi:hypothetical protein